MKVVGLVSGGKDSCFNLMKCVENGHQIVCLANLYPKKGSCEEIDSYMYQSVGYSGVQLYSSACGLPLYRQEIRGGALNTGAQYELTVDDEVEDLYELLMRIKRDHPDIQGVSVGAIQSSYQKVRVENVCARLGLTPLCFLWGADQAELLDEIIFKGVSAIIVKVAAMGLNRTHLGKHLREVRDHLHSLNEKYGVHICGEGGEYETFVLDCPLFSKRILVEEAEPKTLCEDRLAPVAYLSFKTLRLENK